MSLCADTLRPPAISGQSVFEQYAEIDEESGIPQVPMGWRLFGQRFTYDSLVHEKVSPPRLMSRDIVRGLDIMKAFGSKTAEALLQQSDYPKMEGLKDVLDSFETIKACVAYKMDEEEIDYFPFDINETVEPVYVELPGWQTDMTKMQSEDEFPEEFNAYLSFLEEQLGVPIKIVSLGPDREQTIERYTEE